MEQNKIYQACRKEVLQKFFEEQGKNNEVEVCQLTAELYAQKFADWTNSVGVAKYPLTGEWVLIDDMSTIGTTAQLHSKFVEENKGGGDE